MAAAKISPVGTEGRSPVPVCHYTQTPDTCDQCRGRRVSGVPFVVHGKDCSILQRTATHCNPCYQC